jgi:hypothetical protein
MARVRLAVGLEGLACVVAEDRGGAARLTDRLGKRLPLFPREVAADRVGALVDEIGGAPQNLAPRRRRYLPPRSEGGGG